MKLSNFIDGLNTLRPYYKDGDGHVLGAEHDEFHAYATERPLSPEDAKKMEALGWFQSSEDVTPKGDEWTAEDYDPEAGWKAFV